MRKLKNNKGFTLVEIIVVLVILAILAAAMIPAMLGYVEESRGKTYADQARVVYNACQTCATEAAALGASNTEIAAALNGYLAGTEKASITGSSDTALSVCAKIANLIGADIWGANATPTPSMKVTMDDTVAGHVAKVYYDSDGGNGASTGSGYQVEIDISAGTTNVQKDAKTGSVFTWPAS